MEKMWQKCEGRKTAHQPIVFERESSFASFEEDCPLCGALADAEDQKAITDRLDGELDEQRRLHNGLADDQEATMERLYEEIAELREKLAKDEQAIEGGGA